MSAVFKKEFKSYFYNMYGYLFMAVVLAIIGIYFNMLNLRQGYPYFEYVIDSVGFIYLIAVPLLTMRVIAEERAKKTDQLLYTAPVSVTSIVLGKFFAMVAILAVPMLVSCIYPIFLGFFGDVSYLSAYASIFGFTCMGAALIAVGMFISSLTSSQIIAAVLTFGVLFVCSLADTLSDIATTSSFIALIVLAVLVIIAGLILYVMTKNIVVAAGVAAILEAALVILYMVKPTIMEGAISTLLSPLDIFARMSNFSAGVLDIKAIGYFFSVAALFCFFTIQTTEKRRWS